MIRLAYYGLFIAGLFALATFCKLGNETLAEHLGDIYRSPVVQEKVHALMGGAGAQAQKWQRDAFDMWQKKEAQKARPSERSPASERRNIVATAPSARNAAPKPAHDQLSDDDRASLDHLVAEKLKKH